MYGFAAGPGRVFGRGVWDALLETLVGMGLTDDWRHMMDSTTVRGHSQAAGAKGGLTRRVLVEVAAVVRAKSTPEQAELLMHNILPVTPPRCNRVVEISCDYRRYRDRNKIERFFNRLKQARRIATRYDKTKLSFMAFLNLAAARIWLPIFVNRA